MKKCFKCGETKAIECFNKHVKKPDGLQTRCRACQNKTDRDLYASSAERKRLVKERNIDRRKIKQEFIKAYLLAHPCVDCGECDPVVLEFDHVIGKKLFNICDMGYHSLITIQAEISKCEVRCANCHKRVTHKRRNGLLV